MAAKPQLMSGARGQIKIGQKILAYITDVSVTYNVRVQAVHVFGRMNAASVEPLQAGPVNVSIGRMIPVNKMDNASPTGVVNTSAIAEGIEPIINQMLTSDDISVELLDKITGKTIANVRNCRFAGRSLSTSASQLARETIQLTGIYDAGANNENSAPKVGF